MSGGDDVGSSDVHLTDTSHSSQTPRWDRLGPHRQFRTAITDPLPPDVINIL